MLTKQEKAKLIDSIKAVIKYDGMGYDFIVDILHGISTSLPQFQPHHHVQLIQSIVDRAHDEIELIVTDPEFLKEVE